MLLNKEDIELYEAVKDRYSVEEAIKIYEDLYDTHFSTMSEEDMIKRGIASIILEHEGILEDIQNKMSKS